MLLAAGIALSASACGPDNTATATPTPPEPPAASATLTPPPAPADAAAQKATAAYLGMWRDMADAATTSDWQSPALAHNATGEALQTISRSLYADHYNGLVTRGRPVNHPRVSTVDPQHDPAAVAITDCGDSTSWLKRRADTGERAPDGPGGRRHIDAEVKRAVDGSWKVTTFTVREVGSCAR